MIQRFIELGEGYGDIYELCELIDSNKHRIHHAFIFSATKNDKVVNSIAVALKSVGESKFMPIYICREGIPTSSQRMEIFVSAVERAGFKAIPVEIKLSSEFAQPNLFYQYLIGVLRLNNLLPPFQ